jgi:hypothetical protein
MATNLFGATSLTGGGAGSLEQAAAQGLSTLLRLLRFKMLTFVLLL